MTNPFGPVFNFTQVERWILDTAELWFPTYLAEAERQAGEPERTFAPVKSFITANEWDSWPEEHLPCMLVMDTGLGEAPRRTGEGKWSVRRLFGVSLIVQATTRSDVRWSSGLYGAAARSLLLQHQSLGHPDHIGGLDWTDERPAPIPSDDTRNIGAQIALYVVDIKNVADEGGVPRGPQFPETPPSAEPYTPPDDLPVVQPLAPGESSISIRTRKVDE